MVLTLHCPLMTPTGFVLLPCAFVEVPICSWPDGSTTIMTYQPRNPTVVPIHMIQVDIQGQWDVLSHVPRDKVMVLDRRQGLEVDDRAI